MNDLASLLLVLMAGILIGLFFFGGLWWTVQRGLTSNHPACWFFGSSLLRMGIALAGFYFVSSGDWRKLLVCLFGFLIARVVVTCLTRTTGEGSHAP